MLLGSDKTFVTCQLWLMLCTMSPQKKHWMNEWNEHLTKTLKMFQQNGCEPSHKMNEKSKMVTKFSQPNCYHHLWFAL